MNTETDIAARCQEFTDALTEVLAENAIGLHDAADWREHMPQTNATPNIPNTHFA